MSWFKSSVYKKLISMKVGHHRNEFGPMPPIDGQTNVLKYYDSAEKVEELINRIIKGDKKEPWRTELIYNDDNIQIVETELPPIFLDTELG